MGTWPCGTIVLLGELIGTESIAQVWSIILLAARELSLYIRSEYVVSIVNLWRKKVYML